MTQLKLFLLTVLKHTVHHGRQCVWRHRGRMPGSFCSFFTQLGTPPSKGGTHILVGLFPGVRPPWEFLCRHTHKWVSQTTRSNVMSRLALRHRQPLPLLMSCFSGWTHSLPFLSLSELLPPTHSTMQVCCLKFVFFDCPEKNLYFVLF